LYKFQTIEVISKLENDLKNSVISSNIASLWAVLMRLNIKERIKGYERLLEKFLI